MADNRIESELQNRQRLIDKIESYTLALESMPYHLVSTEDLTKILTAIETNWNKLQLSGNMILAGDDNESEDL